MWSDKQINLPNAHFFRVLNLTFCCRKSFHSKAASPCETSGFSFLFFSRFQLVFAAAPLDLIWAVHCSVDGNHWKAEININFWRSYFVKMSWKAFHLVTSYCSFAVFLCRRNHLSINHFRNITGHPALKRRQAFTFLFHWNNGFTLISFLASKPTQKDSACPPFLNNTNLDKINFKKKSSTIIITMSTGQII